MKLKFWRVGTGDAITINFPDSKDRKRNIFIDGGFVGTYRHSIKPELVRIREAGELVDLWVLTHTDRDHIGGVEAFIKDVAIADRERLVVEFWFNWSDYTFVPPTEKVSVAQGIVLREYLQAIGKLPREEIKVTPDSIVLYDCTFAILSPDQQSLEKSKIHWQRQEHPMPVAGGRNDHESTIEELSVAPASEDTDPFNGGSIAFLVSWRERSILLLGDSHPSVIVQSLTRLGYSPANRLRVDFVKLSHHGSKNNTSRGLIQLLDSDNYIILAEGSVHSLPNKWTLANILVHPERDFSRTITFYFNYDNPRLRSIFDTDSNKDKYNFRCVFSTEPFLELDLA